jgi:hypothetical protein
MKSPVSTRLRDERRAAPSRPAVPLAREGLQ